MAIFTEVKRLGDWLKGEQTAPQLYSRDQITLLSTGAVQALTTGTVLGKITASGKWTQLNTAGADGSQNAAGILLLDTSVPIGVDTQAVAIVRAATVMDLGLTWPAGINAGQISTAVGQLKSAGVIVRTGA